MRRRLAGVAIVVGAALLLPSAAGAAEAPSHPLLGETNGVPTFGSRPPTGAFEDACGVALDSQGDRYVADYYHDAVDVFDPSGEYVTQIARESDGNGPCGLAVDAEGRVYVQNWRAEVVRYTPSSYPPTAATTYGQRTLIDPSGTATGIGLDAGGSLYVDDGTYVAKFEAPVGAGETPARIGEGELTEGYGLAVSAYPGTSGRIYVPDAAAGAVRAFGPAGEPLAPIDGAGTPQGGFASLVDAAVAVDPSDGHVFVADDLEAGSSEYPATAIDEFNPQGGYRGQIARWVTHPANEPGVSIEHHLIDAAPPGLAIDGAGHVFVTSGNDDNTGSRMVDKNGILVEGSLLYTFGPTGAARVLTVSEAGSGGGAVTSSPAGIDCGSACVAEFNEGAKVTLTASPDAHSVFRGWSGACAGTGTCTVTMSAARSVGAEFEALPQQPLEVGVAGSGTVTSQPGGISCPTICSGEFNEGSTVTLTETPAPHHRFTGWGGLDCDESTQVACEVQMSEAKLVSAGFQPIPQEELQVSVAGEGSVTSAPAGVACPSACAAQFDEGQRVILTAQPAPHMAVAWTGCDSTPAEDECEVAMGEAREVSATFAARRHSVAVSVAGPGSVSASSGPISGCGAAGGTCSGSYLEGETVTFTATAAPGAGFVGWSGGSCSGAGTCQIEVASDTTLTANFAAIPPGATAASLKLGKPKIKGTTAAIAVTVSGPGTLTVSAGHRISPRSQPSTGAGALRVRFALSGRGRRLLRRSGSVQLAVRFFFAPADGGAAAKATKTFTFEAKPGRHRH